VENSFYRNFANFSTGRVYDQIRQSVAYSDKNVKICYFPWINIRRGRTTHQILEDRVNENVARNDCNQHLRLQSNQAATLTLIIMVHLLDVQLFNFTPADEPFVIGKAIML
jgi:transketolase